MAIYDFQSRILRRSQGNTSVGYAAYLSAQNIYDEYHGEQRKYSKAKYRDRLYHSDILAPDHAPEWVFDRKTLWNRNEAAERRHDSQVGRDIQVALPVELTHEQKIALGRKFIQEQYVAKGMVADVNFHNFKGKGSHNPHMQVLLTTRRVEKEGFSKKKEDAWRPPIVKDPKTGKPIVDPEFIKAERKVWEEYCNQALEQHGHTARVDCRSLKDKGIDRVPQPKLGKAHHMEQRKEWRNQTRAGDHKREAQEVNDLKAQLEQARQEGDAISREIRQELTNHAFDLGHELARHDHAGRQRQADSLAIARQKPENRGLEPWKRDWEHEQEKRRRKRTALDRKQLRQKVIARKQAALETGRNYSPQVQPSADERQMIAQWQQFFERERGKSCEAADSSQVKRPSRDITPDQQAIQLADAMAAFGGAEEKEAQEKRLKQGAPRRHSARQPPVSSPAADAGTLSWKDAEFGHPRMENNGKQLDEQLSRIAKDAAASGEYSKPSVKTAGERRQQEMLAARTAKEAVTLKNDRFKNPVAERIFQNAKVQQTYQPRRDGVQIDKEFQKEWAYQYQAKRAESLNPKTDSDVAKKLAICGHRQEEVAQVIEKHSPYAAKLEREQGRDAARQHVRDASHYPQALYRHEKSYISGTGDQKVFSEMADKYALERHNLGKERHSIEEIPNLSAKRDVIEQRQQEQRQREREQQAHQITKDITR